LIKKLPEYLDAHKGITTLYLKKKQFEEALESYQKILEAEKNDRETIAQFSWIQFLKLKQNRTYSEEQTSNILM